VLDQLGNPRAEGLLNLDASRPLGLIADLIEGADSLEERVGGTLADALIVMIQQVDEDKSAGLDIWQEEGLGMAEESTDSIGCDFLLNGDGAVDVEQFVEIKVLELDRLVSVGVSIGADVDSVGGRGTRGEGLGRVGDDLGAVLFTVLILVAALEKSGDNTLEVRGKLLLEDLRHHAKEEEAALPEASTTHGKTVEGLGHHVGEVGAEVLLSNSLGEGADGIHGDATELSLLPILSECQKVGEDGNGGLEIGDESLLRGVGGAADSPSDDRLDRDGGGLEQTSKLLHDEVEILVDVLMEDLEKGVESGASSLLCDLVVDEVHDGLRECQQRVCESNKRVGLTGIRTACLETQGSSSHSQRQLTAMQDAFLTEPSLSFRPASMKGQI